MRQALWSEGAARPHFRLALVALSTLVVMALTTASASAGGVVRETVDRVSGNPPAVPPPQAAPVQAPPPAQAPPKPQVPVKPVKPEVPVKPQSPPSLPAVKAPAANPPSQRASGAPSQRASGAPSQRASEATRSLPEIVRAADRSPNSAPGPGDPPDVTGGADGSGAQTAGGRFGDKAPTAAREQAAPAPAGANAHGSRRGPAGVAVESAEIVPLARWFAYVWPAFALGPMVETLAAAVPLPSEALVLLRSASEIPLIAGLAAAATGFDPAGAGAGIFDRPTTPNMSHEPGIQAPSQGGEEPILEPTLILILGSALLMASLYLAIWRDLHWIGRHQ